jgi:hypothetical protein
VYGRQKASIIRDKEFLEDKRKIIKTQKGNRQKLYKIDFQKIKYNSNIKNL